MENEGPYRTLSAPKPEQIKIFWNYATLTLLENEVNEWLCERGNTIDVIACDLTRGHYIVLRYRERE